MDTWFTLEVRGHFLKEIRNGKPVFTPVRTRALKMGRLTAHSVRINLRGGNLMMVSPYAITCAEKIPAAYK